MEELVEATQQACLNTATDPANNQSRGHLDAESLLLRECQGQSLPEEVAALHAQKPVPSHSLAPEWDSTHCMVRVGGRLESSSDSSVHPFYSTGINCFGPYLVTIGRRNKKRGGVLFKCLTTHAIYIELLNSMDVDAFLLVLRRFIARRG